MKTSLLIKLRISIGRRLDVNQPLINKQELYSEFKNNTTFHKIQRTNIKFLSVISIRVFQYLTSTDNKYGCSKSFNTERIKSVVDFFLE